MIKLLLANKMRLKKNKLFWSGLFITVGYCLLANSGLLRPVLRSKTAAMRS